MKESKLIEMRNNVEALGSVADRMISELQNLKTLTMGMFQTMQKMPGYKEAIEELKKEQAVDGQE